MYYGRIDRPAVLEKRPECRYKNDTYEDSYECCHQLTRMGASRAAKSTIRNGHVAAQPRASLRMRKKTTELPWWYNPRRMRGRFTSELYVGARRGQVGRTQAKHTVKNKSLPRVPPGRKAVNPLQMRLERPYCVASQEEGRSISNRRFANERVRCPTTMTGLFQKSTLDPTTSNASASHETYDNDRATKKEE